MDSSLSKEEREEYEAFVKAHPLPENYDPNKIDDSRTKEAEDMAMSYLLKQLLDGKL